MSAENLLLAVLSEQMTTITCKSWRPEHSEVVPLWYGWVAEQEIKAATLSPTASVLSLKGETKEKAYAVLSLKWVNAGGGYL